MAEYENESTLRPNGRKSLYEKDKSKVFKKYPVGSDADKELIFNFPYILHKETVFYIENNAHIMFIIRGPPSTGKATLSEMLTERYPNATHCCADHYFARSFASTKRTQESIKSSHAYCQKKVENACKSDVQTIIVQNTHMRKWEMQVYLDFAALYNYTVIMAITLYRFDCTPKALAENNTDGLDIKYFQNRLRQWEDVPPMLTGWFVSPDDALHILHDVMKVLEALLTDGKFCRVFNIFDTDDIERYFKPRRLLYCLACYLKNPYLMKSYYLSDEVQSSYGKSFTFSIFGYLVSTTSVLGIVNVTEDMKHLTSDSETHGEERRHSEDVSGMMGNLDLQGTLEEYSTTVSFPKQEELPQGTTLTREDWNETEVIKASSCSFIDLAQKDFKPFDIKAAQRKFANSMKNITDGDGCISCDGYNELDGEDECKMYRLPDDVWLIRPFQKINVKSIFTGLYV